MAASTPSASSFRAGVAAAAAAYTLWGFMPIYFLLVREVPALEVLAHRVVWAVPFGLLIIMVRNQWSELRLALSNPRLLGLLALSALVISLNWLIYIIAVQRGQIFQASLGYYINPLMVVLAGIWLFGERLRRAQWWAVGLAALGVGVLTIYGGQLPLISLLLAATFTVYGVIRKQAVVGAMPGLLIETLFLLPLFGAYLLWLGAQNRLVFAVNDPSGAMLMLAGPVTVIPLLLFAIGARRLPLSLLGVLQYIGPTLQFFIGLAYGEALTVAHMICFLAIWLAVALFCIDQWRASRPS